MKLKMLSMLVVLGLFFATGPNVNAAEENKAMTPAQEHTMGKVGADSPLICPPPFSGYTEADYMAKWDSLFNTGVCTLMGADPALAAACTKFCAATKAGTMPAFPDAKGCAAELAKDTGSNVKTAVNAIVNTGCAVLCSGTRAVIGGCNSCQFPKVKAFCGTICCNLNAVTAMGNCLVSNGNTPCSAYTGGTAAY